MLPIEKYSCMLKTGSCTPSHIIEIFITAEQIVYKKIYDAGLSYLYSMEVINSYRNCLLLITL